MAKMLEQVHCAPRSGHFLPILTPPIDSTVKNTARVSLDIQCSYPIYVYSLTILTSILHDKVFEVYVKLKREKNLCVASETFFCPGSASSENITVALFYHHPNQVQAILRAALSVRPSVSNISHRRNCSLRKRTRLLKWSLTLHPANNGPYY